MICCVDFYEILHVIFIVMKLKSYEGLSVYNFLYHQIFSNDNVSKQILWRKWDD